MLFDLAGHVGASGGFSMEISTTGIAYQLYFHLSAERGAKNRVLVDSNRTNPSDVLALPANLCH